jgi:phosphoglucomutase
MASVVEMNYARWLASAKVSSEDKALLKAMDQKTKDDAFFQDIEFGTAGMRGVLGPGTNRMNTFTVQKATIAFGMFLLEKFPDAKTRGVVISHDNRHLSRQFTLESARLLNEMGLKAYIFDSLRPTPELSYAVRYLHTVGGIMVTASHNPKQYNGYKVYDENGCQLVPDKIARLLEIIASLPDELHRRSQKSPDCGRNRHDSIPLSTMLTSKTSKRSKSILSSRRRASRSSIPRSMAPRTRMRCGFSKIAAMT